MDYKVKSYVMLSIIFVLGFMGGMLVKDLITKSPSEQIRVMRDRGGFMLRLDPVLDLNEKQKEEIMPILEKYEKRFATDIQKRMGHFKAIIDSLKAELKPHLTEKQIQKLDEEFMIQRRIGFPPPDEKTGKKLFYFKENESN